MIPMRVSSTPETPQRCAARCAGAGLLVAAFP